jgi:predicted nucleic acid-binding protein
MTRVALDSNILVYLAGVSRTSADDAKVARTRDLIKRLSALVSLVAPAQTLGELFVVMRRSGASPEEAREVLMEFAEAFGTAPTEIRTALAATDLAVDHKLQFWDALILTAAAEAGCSLLLSEDMQDGFVTRGMSVSNPFADKLHPKLLSLLDDRT